VFQLLEEIAAGFNGAQPAFQELETNYPKALLNMPNTIDTAAESYFTTNWEFVAANPVYHETQAEKTIHPDYMHAFGPATINNTKTNQLLMEREANVDPLLLSANDIYENVNLAQVIN
jgi:hypothetical protein